MLKCFDYDQACLRFNLRRGGRGGDVVAGVNEAPIYGARLGWALDSLRFRPLVSFQKFCDYHAASTVDALASLFSNA